MSVEEWKVIEGFAPRMVSSHGRFKGARGAILKLSTNIDGYLHLCLYSNGKRRVTKTVHRWVAEAFLGPRPKGLVTCHNNGVITDNRIENLRYDTILSNAHDSIKHGTKSRGEKMPTAKLNDVKVAQVRRLHHAGIPALRISKIFCVSNSIIDGVIKGKRWRHVL